MSDESITFIASDGTVWSPAIVRSVSGFGVGPAKTFRQPTPYFDGAVYIDVLQQPRVLEVGFTISATSRADLFAQRAQAVAALSTAKGLGTLQFVVPGVGVRQLTCAVEQGPAFGSQGRSGVLGLSDVVQFVAPDPAWVDPVGAVVTYSITGTTGVVFPLAFPVTFGASTLGGTQTAVNAGDLQTWPVITVVGPGQAPAASVVASDGTILTSSFPGLALQAGDVLVVDHRPGHQAATLTPFGGAATNVLGQRAASSYFWALPSGATPLTVSLADATSQSSVTVAWFSRYSGV